MKLSNDPVATARGSETCDQLMLIL